MRNYNTPGITAGTARPVNIHQDAQRIQWAQDESLLKLRKTESETRSVEDLLASEKAPSKRPGTMPSPKPVQEAPPAVTAVVEPVTPLQYGYAPVSRKLRKDPAAVVAQIPRGVAMQYDTTPVDPFSRKLRKFVPTPKAAPAVEEPKPVLKPETPLARAVKKKTKKS